MVGAEAMVTYPGIGFLLNPIFLRAFSASLHLVLLLLLFVSWVCKRIKGSALENCKSTRNGWSDEKLVTLLDLVLRTLAWGAVCVYLHTQFHDIVKKHQSLTIQFLVPDIVYVITGMFLCHSGFLGKNQDEESILREPLLNGSTSISRVESDKSKGEATVTPFSKAGFFSLLPFSWMGPLIAEAFRNKFQCDSGGSSGVTTLKLVKALISDQSSTDHNDLQQGFDSFLPVKAGSYYWEIINFMSVDAERIGGFSWYMHDPWILIMQVALALLILYRNLGLASVAAFFETVIVMLTNVPLGKWKEKFQDKLMESKIKG
ncbi:ABC transporter C family member 3 [Vitis vinifera]|uniref:ABC transporter C family member 3 n=1 Tax=Vitis vinifera TaxID=29760 RepID=A0A438ER69_VITVI|nr:ABC transporter C family member 3 [Vitis vinifera]